MDSAVFEGHKGRPIKRRREDSEGRVRSSSKLPRDKSGVRDKTVCHPSLDLLFTKHVCSNDYIKLLLIQNDDLVVSFLTK